MGRFFDIVSPFSTDYSEDIYVFDDNSVSAQKFVNMLGFYSIDSFCAKNKELEKFIKKRDGKRNPRGGKETYQFVDVDDMPEILRKLDRDPEDLKKVFHAKVTLKLCAPKERELSDQEEEKRAAPAFPKKRDREEKEEQNLSDDFIKEFAKRYITEHPEEARNIIISNLVTKKVQEIIKKLN